MKFRKLTKNDECSPELNIFVLKCAVQSLFSHHYNTQTIYIATQACFAAEVLLAQWLERKSYELTVGGSNPP